METGKSNGMKARTENLIEMKRSVAAPGIIVAARIFTNAAICATSASAVTTTNDPPIQITLAFTL